MVWVMLCMTGATLFLRRGARFAHFSRMGARPSHMAGVAVQGHVLDTVVGRGAFATVFAARTPAGDRVALTGRAITVYRAELAPAAEPHA